MENKELYGIASSINEKFSSMTDEEWEEYKKQRNELERKRKEEYQKQFNEDLENMTNANDFLNKYKLDKNEMFDCLMYALDPTKKALFNDIKRIDNRGKIILQKYEINGKWYWGLPEESDNNE